MKNFSAQNLPLLFSQNYNFIDVRAPIEFAAGSIPGAINLPLINNDERHLIGTVYKTKGQNAAVELGHQLVSGEIREQRLDAWLKAFQLKPNNTVIYCFRGGLRSKTVQAWMQEQGAHCPLLIGGYKAARFRLLTALSEDIKHLNFKIIAGETGSGKTSYLKKNCQHSIDLEALAQHRGSAFGALKTPQPSQADFENQIAQKILAFNKTTEPICLESESRMIGKLVLPEALAQIIKNSPRTELNVKFEDRVNNVFNDYVVNSALGVQGDLSTFNDFRSGITKIAKKLGGLRAQEILCEIEASENDFKAQKGLERNKVWIAKILKYYYDPLYAKHRQKTKS